MIDDSKYQLVNNLFENEEDQIKEWSHSKANIEMDFKTGDFTGHYKGFPFSGSFTIEHTAAGFVKGFVYTVSLGYLSKQVTEDKDYNSFIEQLIKTNKIYFNPQKTLEPDYINIEFWGDEKSLNFVKVSKLTE